MLGGHAISWAARHGATPRPPPAPPPYWTEPAEALYARLATGPRGLSGEEAARRLANRGPTPIGDPGGHSRTRVFVRQVKSPLLWLLIVAALISLATGEWSDAVIVLIIVVATVLIGYAREYRAERAVAALRSRIQTTAEVCRDGVFVRVPRVEVVTGDVVRLAAGTLVAADAVVLDASDCFVSEAALTGESFPVEKHPGPCAADTPLARRTNVVSLGTNVRSGVAECLVVATGGETEIARIASRLARPAPETDFDRGIRRFGYLLTSAMFVMVLVVFAAHTLAGRPPIETLLFSIALAVGLSPELLPAILSINLARGAQMMARRGVLVRRLTAIENLGSMDVLCTDKTGTLTEGIIRLDGAYDSAGAPSDTVRDLARINARLQTGLPSPLDDAILESVQGDATCPHKLAEIPFDFIRRRLSVIVDGVDGPRLIVKGAFAAVLDACARDAAGTPLDDPCVAALTARYEAWSRQGFRVLAVASGPVDRQPHYGRELETGLRFEGFLTFLDRPKADAAHALADLARLGVRVKMITGDNPFVAAQVAALVGLDGQHVLSGAALEALDDAALWRLAPITDVFAEVDPNQKARIIRALRRAGHVVAFLGDGVNDAPAMHAADTSLSVEGAVDVARETADFVLLERSLDVIRGGVEEGRRTFANTMKYILTTTSANLGNMISMAAASLVLPFLPLLAGQILLNNLLSDVPALGIADDRVDPELVAAPPRWNLRVIGQFMGVFGLVSSCFDAATFVVLLVAFRAGPDLFRSAWFVESLLTELAVALVVRTRRPAWTSRPGRLLLASSVVMMAIAPLVPWMPFADRLGFVPLPWRVLGAIAVITTAYVLATEAAKRVFYRHERIGRVAA